MAQNITLLGASYSAVPAVQLPRTGGGSAAFWDVSDVTAGAGDVVAGKQIRAADGTLTPGTLAVQHVYSGSGAPAASLGQDGDIYLQTS